MAVRRILQLGNPLLREISRPVKCAAEAHPVLADLRDTLHNFQSTHGFGRGIAAVQIGVPLRVIYIEIHGAAYSIVNPVFESLSDEKFELWDDCFSFPDLLVRVERSISARLRYDGSDGTSEMLTAERDFAELLQHEVDHLDGILAIDRAIDRHSWCWRSEYPVRADSESAP
jgi:peptide deformylase